MLFRSLILFLLLAPSGVYVPAQNANPALAKVSANQRAGVLQGRILNPKGQPLAGIHVELDEPRTAIPITSAYTQPDGTFAMYNVPLGEYEVVAESLDSEVSDVVIVDAQKPVLELRLAPKVAAQNQQQDTVSVAQILAPASARKLYAKAREGFLSGRQDDAKKLLQQALEIDPHYADALTLRGLIELPNNDPLVPQQMLEQAVHLNPGDGAAYVALAALYNRQARFDDALRSGERAISIAPRGWHAYLEMAKAWIGKDIYAEGLVFIRRAERLGGTANAEVHLIKAIGLFQLQQFDESRYEAEAAMARDRDGRCAGLAQHLLAQLNRRDERAAKR
jgi:tetratricopeptide (TPR) repeat protein